MPKAYLNHILKNIFSTTSGLGLFRRRRISFISLPFLLARRFFFQTEILRQRWDDYGSYLYPGFHPGLINYAPLELGLGGYFPAGVFLLFLLYISIVPYLRHGDGFVLYFATELKSLRDKYLAEGMS